MHGPDELQRRLEAALLALDLGGRPAALYDPVRYVLSLGGKRMRPLLTLAACEMFGGNPDEAMGPAVGIELFHNFTLVHDDIMDNAPLRRNKPTVQEKWNGSTAILAGDAMLVMAYRQVALCPPDVSGAVLDVFSRTALKVCEGQQMDLDFEVRSDVRIEEYMEMIGMKTAALVAGCLETGAATARASEKSRGLIAAFGENLGLGFQIQDDVLDVFGDARAFGKQTGGDILSNKKTYLLITALQRAKGNDRRELERWLSADDRPEEKVSAVKALYERLSVRQAAEEQMEKCFARAAQAMEDVAVDPERKEVLLGMAQQIRERKT